MENENKDLVVAEKENAILDFASSIYCLALF